MSVVPKIRFSCVFLFGSIISVAQELSPLLQSQHGTCAIALATNENVALIVDSRLTLVGSTQSCIESHPEACKAVLVRKDVLLAITGIFNDPVKGIDWRVGDETKRLLLKLPKQVEVSDLNAFMMAWFNILVAHFDKKSNLGLDRQREVSTLLIATRIHGSPYIYKASIILNARGLFEFTGSHLILSEYPQLFYAGSCRDNIATHSFDGKSILAADPPNALYKWELQELGQQKMMAHTVAQFVPLLREYEKVFEKIGESKNKCWIGPPYDAATWANGAAGWTTNFKLKCRAGSTHK